VSSARRTCAPPRAALLLLAALAPGCGGSGGPVGPAPEDGDVDRRGWAEEPTGLYGYRRQPGGGLGAIGYASGSSPAPAATGLVRWERGRTEDGPTLMCSGDAAEAVLVSMEGVVLHRWGLPYDQLPGVPPAEGAHQLPWRRVRMLPEGDLLAIHSGRALVRVGRTSDLRWVVTDRVHHDLDIAPDGTIVALSRTERVVPEVDPNQAVVDDLVVRYTPDGEALGSVSLWSAFASSAWAPMLAQLTVRSGDVMHANSIDLLDEEEAGRLGVDGVAAGQALVCLRDLDLVVTLDLDAGRFTWLSRGPLASPWRAPHDPSVAADGSLLVFDNRGGPAESSRLLRIDPGSAAIRWRWQAAPPSAFASFFCGTVQQLPGGNLLVAESTQGRAFELDPGTGEVVWDYVSPRTTGEAGELIAALFMAERVPAPAWLER
jgi:hypothetical protein